MAALIFDASAIVKRYLNEVGTAWVQSLADPIASHEIFLTRITRVEVIATVTRRGRGGPLPASTAASLLVQFRHDSVHQYNILEVTPALLTDAEQLAETHGLRAYDAVHLAVTIELHRARSAAGLSRLTLISSDQELNTAATAEGLDVDDPTAHP
jgi:predicted nucleic acid-binding protein